MKLKIVYHKVAFGGGAGRLLSGTRHERENRGYEHVCQKLSEAFQHLSPQESQNLPQSPRGHFAINACAAATV
jgi:hypothetical protein